MQRAAIRAKYLSQGLSEVSFFTAPILVKLAAAEGPAVSQTHIDCHAVQPNVPYVESWVRILFTSSGIARLSVIGPAGI